jgi:hypothetical protein
VFAPPEELHPESANCVAAVDIMSSVPVIETVDVGATLDPNLVLPEKLLFAPPSSKKFHLPVPAETPLLKPDAFVIVPEAPVAISSARNPEI